MKTARTISRRRAVLWAAGLVLLLAAGCASAPVEPTQVAPPAPEPAPFGPPYLVHTVKYPGESVSIIAAWYTGDIENWKILAQANPGIDPNRIYEGIRINVPERLAKTRDPMTREFVDSFYPKPRPKAAPKPAPSPGPSEEPDLFGPRTLPRN